MFSISTAVPRMPCSSDGMSACLTCSLLASCSSFGRLENDEVAAIPAPIPSPKLTHENFFFSAFRFRCNSRICSICSGVVIYPRDSRRAIISSTVVSEILLASVCTVFTMIGGEFNGSVGITGGVGDSIIGDAVDVEAKGDSMGAFGMLSPRNVSWNIRSSSSDLSDIDNCLKDLLDNSSSLDFVTAPIGLASYSAMSRSVVHSSSGVSLSGFFTYAERVFPAFSHDVNSELFPSSPTSFARNDLKPGFVNPNPSIPLANFFVLVTAPIPIKLVGCATISVTRAANGYSIPKPSMVEYYYEYLPLPQSPHNFPRQPDL